MCAAIRSLRLHYGHNIWFNDLSKGGVLLSISNSESMVILRHKNNTNFIVVRKLHFFRILNRMSSGSQTP